MSPPAIYNVESIDRSEETGFELPRFVIEGGQSIAPRRKILLWEKFHPDTTAALPLQRLHHHKQYRVEQLCALPNGVKYWEIYIETENSLLIRDVSQVHYHIYKD
jgi:hypothetical protein